MLFEASLFAKSYERFSFALVFTMRINMLYQRSNRKNMSSCSSSGESYAHKSNIKFKI